MASKKRPLETEEELLSGTVPRSCSVGAVFNNVSLLRSGTYFDSNSSETTSSDAGLLPSSLFQPLSMRKEHPHDSRLFSKTHPLDTPTFSKNAVNGWTVMHAEIDQIDKDIVKWKNTRYNKGKKDDRIEDTANDEINKLLSAREELYQQLHCYHIAVTLIWKDAFDKFHGQGCAMCYVCEAEYQANLLTDLKAIKKQEPEIVIRPQSHSSSASSFAGSIYDHNYDIGDMGDSDFWNTVLNDDVEVN